MICSSWMRGIWEYAPYIEDELHRTSTILIVEPLCSQYGKERLLWPLVRVGTMGDENLYTVGTFTHHSVTTVSQMSNARRVRSSRHILQTKIQRNVESFTLTAKLNAVSENLSFLRWVCVGNEVTVTHKICWREIRFAGTCSASFSYEIRARKLMNWFRLQGIKRPDVT